MYFQTVLVNKLLITLVMLMLSVKIEELRII